MLSNGKRHGGRIRMVGFEIGGAKGAIKVEVDTTDACIIFAEVNKVEVFAWWRIHALLFIVRSSEELLVWTDGWVNAAGLVRASATFVVIFSRRSG